MSARLGFTEPQLAKIALNMLEPGNESGATCVLQRVSPKGEPPDAARFAAVYDQGYFPSSIDRSELLDSERVLGRLREIAYS